jgi:large subunit ribosomal protein L32e
MRIISKPSFITQGRKNFKRINPGWRRPRGNQSKLRMSKRCRGFMPHPGYGAPAELRGLHPSRMMEMMVHTPQQLDIVDAKKTVVRIASGVGVVKRVAIQAKAEQMKIRVLNPKAVSIKKAKKEVEKK